MWYFFVLSLASVVGLEQTHPDCQAAQNLVEVGLGRLHPLLAADQSKSWVHYQVDELGPLFDALIDHMLSS
jgi:hypothetical protein